MMKIIMKIVKIVIGVLVVLCILGAILGDKKETGKKDIKNTNTVSTNKNPSIENEKKEEGFSPLIKFPTDHTLKSIFDPAPLYERKMCNKKTGYSEVRSVYNILQRACVKEGLGKIDIKELYAYFSPEKARKEYCNCLVTQTVDAILVFHCDPIDESMLVDDPEVRKKYAHTFKNFKNYTKSRFQDFSWLCFNDWIGNGAYKKWRNKYR